MEDRGAAEEGGAGGAPLDVRRADSTDAATVQSSAAAGGTKEDDAAAASRGSKTWTCEHCSLENDEPDAEALLLQTGGLVSCVVCLKVRGQGARSRCVWCGWTVGYSELSSISSHCLLRQFVYRWLDLPGLLADEQAQDQRLQGLRWMLP